ncbi:MAG: hypothetical protein AB1511_14050 [Deinococcota bacterium]
MAPGLPPAPPAAVGLDPAQLEAITRSVAHELPHVTSLLVARRGCLAFERYFSVQPDEPQDLQSVT